ncbi:MAG: hypothetical protein ACJ8CR_31015 [Roseiflexaceae bacterium]
MPDPHKLVVLAELRHARGLTLAQMATACGLEGRKGRESASAWEQGRSVPHTRRRGGFIDYLGHTLGLRHDPMRFQAVWHTLTEEWGWEPLSAAEWRDHFPDLLESYQRASGSEPPGFAGDAERADLLLHIQNELSALRSRLERLPEADQRALGAAHPFTAAGLDQVELLRLAQAHLQDAIVLLGRVLDSREADDDMINELIEHHPTFRHDLERRLKETPVAWEPRAE